ncbi:MAG TPA: pyridoxal-phosphate dependent enzyme [Candidatus Limnocylindrales bacterium]|jgi:D-cysteine desulfhydrase family pyridoxal phosphate-dependent enzyme|nr:pyridoxal-phosphate dependent enzyme [Candidatus Limnocylindrales bacterium]
MPPSVPDLPRFELLDGPSPLQPLPRLSRELGGRADLWIKREDLLPLAFGGNKLRNLEFHVGAALAGGADTLVTSGRRWSNHCRLTAAAGARAGLAVHLVLSGPPVDPPGPNQLLDELLGATVHVTTTAERAERAARVEAVVESLRTSGFRPYVVPVGGSGPAGAVGQVLAGLEFAEQAAERGIDVHAVVVPSATGGTQAGLIVGLRLAAAAARVHGVAVAHPPDVLLPAIAALLGSLGEQTGCRVAPSEIVLDGGQLGEGYGHPTPAAEEATRLLARSEGILVDPIYTAKALAGLVEAVRNGTFDGRTVVFWHAGGTPGLFERLD